MKGKLDDCLSEARDKKERSILDKQIDSMTDYIREFKIQKLYVPHIDQIMFIQEKFRWFKTH